MIESLPNRPLGPAEVYQLENHPRIENSVTIEALSGVGIDGTVAAMVLIRENVVKMSLESDGWEKSLVAKGVSNEKFKEMAKDFQHEYMGA